MFGLFKKSFTCHVLDSGRGYYTSEITPSDVESERKLTAIAEGKNLYMIIFYEDGQKKEQFVPASRKDVWLKLKRENY